ncbi:MAG: CocE/NonD family hydrolase [Albidovulum sp.]
MAENIKEIETLWIPMPDGARLAARVWMPEDAERNPVPAILEYIPYRRREFTRVRDDNTHPRFAWAGYGVIRVDMRGSGDSDGLMHDEYAQQELDDGCDVIAWVAAQPWCDGNVGMMGKSWGAYNSFQVAAMRPPALRAIIPVMGTDDRWEEDIHFRGGVMATDNFWWGSIMQLFNAAPPDPDIVGDRWRDMWRERLDAMTLWINLWAEHQTKDTMWKHGSVSQNYADIQVPVYFFGGWADLYRDTPFRIAEHLKAPCKVLMGPWAHLYPHDGIPGPKVDFVDEAIRWWDHWLKGKANGIMDEPRLRFYMQDSAAPETTITHRTGRWVDVADWPSVDVTGQTLWLNAGGLGAAADQAGMTMTICSPQSYGAAGGDMTSFATPGDMPGDQRVDAGGALLFRSAPLDGPMEILGQPKLRLTVAADRPQGFVTAILADEAPDGAQSLISRGFANLTHRISAEVATPVIAGEEMEISVTLHGMAWQVPAGHRLVLHLASTYWPILWPSPEPVTLSLRPGLSAIEIPVLALRTNAPPPRDLAPPSPAAPSQTTQLSEGSMARDITTDLITGTIRHRMFIDGGVFGPIGKIRFDAIGTEFHDVSERIYEIHPDDPLSAKATMTQSRTMERGNWKVRIETTSEMTASSDAFHLSAHVECWEGDTPFHRVDWSHNIPRNGM